MGSPKVKIPTKTCVSCGQKMVELFDSYTTSCPECNSETKQVLVNTNGVWVWK